MLDLRGFGARNLVMTDHVHPTAFGQVWIAERALDVLAPTGWTCACGPSTLIRPGERTRLRALQGDWTYVYRRLKVRLGSCGPRRRRAELLEPLRHVAVAGEHQQPERGPADADRGGGERADAAR